MSIVNLFKRILRKGRSTTSPPEGLCLGSPVVVNLERIRVEPGAIISIGDHSRIYGHVKAVGKESRLSIGRECYISPVSAISCLERISIGNHVLISDYCMIIDHDGHPIEKHLRREDIANRWRGIKRWENVRHDAIDIGDDVWIGPHSMVMKGVKIGNGCIIGAGSVVLHDCPEDTLVAGNPAQIKRRLQDGSPAQP